MKKLFTFFFIIMNFSFLQAQVYREWVRKADSCYAVKNYKMSVEYYEKAFKIEHKSSSDLYNATCSAALNNNDKKAFKWLDLAIDNGYENIAHIKIDNDLKSLYEKKEWAKIIDKLQKKVDILSANYDKPLEKELLDIYAEDQGIRGKFMDVYKDPKSDKRKIDSIGKIMGKKTVLISLRSLKYWTKEAGLGKM
ncbi:TPR end-of-group domain-containing protein [uncultured Flavobacterium sp.]|uniref:TPR end-of-group domain-containing protein n=1 Tax=uncultured Flavobacterium sp. TaxID=165435 RepID=UPI00292E8E67|nr:hypothetical protein [uncultured Flavobacterium sp.]